MDHRYIRPPLPPPPPPPYPPQSPADPYQRPPPPSLPPPPNIPWPYAPTQQFQYQPQSQHSPSPPSPQWGPHTVPSSDHTQYPPYPSHQPPPYHYPPPRPQHVPQPYSQDWGSGGWTQHQNWDYSVNSNGEDWEAKAKAWAASNYPPENQHAQSQSIVAGRPEGQNYPLHQYSQPIDSHLLEGPRPLAPPSNYQQHPVVVGPPNGLGPSHFQESQHTSSGSSSYPSDTHPHYAARDGGLAGDSIAMLHQHEKSSHGSSVHQQEVPSSYSSVAGYDAGERYDRFNGSSSLPVHSTGHHQPQPHHFFGSQPAEVVTDPSDQPLSFAPHFNHHMDQHAQTNFAHPAGGPVQGVDPVNFSSNYAWPPSSAPAAVYPSMPPNIQSGPQADLPASGHSMPLFPTGASFHSTFPVTGASFGSGSGVTTHSAAFPGDTFGVSERPKKASVPNWLREEIIKKKAAIPSSALQLPEEDTQSIEEDNNSFSRNGDQDDDNRSIDSSRLPEDDNEDEEEVEAARTAAINQEIKRILTEVLLKVTDELFDEIATKVLKEDEISVEAGNDADFSNHQILLPSPQDIPKTSANVVAPNKTQGVGFNDAGENVSGPQGDILGLGNYASDEEDDEIQSSEKLDSNQNGSPKEVPEDQGDFSAKLNSNGVAIKSTVKKITDSAAENAELNDTEAAEELLPTGIQHSERQSRSTEDERKPGSDSSKSHKSVTKKAAEIDSDSKRSADDETRNQNTRHRSDKDNRQEDYKSPIGKDRRDSETAKDRVDKKGDVENQKHEERRGRTDYHNGSKHRESETVEKTKDSKSSRRRSPSDGKEGTSPTERDTRQRGKEDNDEKRRDKSRDEKRERSRHKNESESSRHKRHWSPSVGDRGRKDYSDESSDDSRRKSRQSRRRKSPSPIRSRKRQVSRSPHSKHSKRRHSPYSSHETTRGKRSKSRSRSRSPAHRRR